MWENVGGTEEIRDGESARAGESRNNMSGNMDRSSESNENIRDKEEKGT